MPDHDGEVSLNIYMSRSLSMMTCLCRRSDKVSGFERPLFFEYKPIVPVIKIYGIYTHTQLNRIWDAVGQHLAGKGKEYRRRSDFLYSQRARWLIPFCL